MDPVMLLGYIAGSCTTCSFLPQVFRTWRTKSCHDLSWGMLLIFASGIFFWFIYGILIKEMPIILANAVTLILVLIIVFLKFRIG
jgi:MtN3 and saliva related transmembrane protein